MCNIQIVSDLNVISHLVSTINIHMYQLMYNIYTDGNGWCNQSQMNHGYIIRILTNIEPKQNNNL